MLNEKVVANEVFVKQKNIAKHVERFCKVDGIYETAISSLHFIKSSYKSDPIHTLHEPALCIVVQGIKEVMLAQKRYRYDPSHYLVVSVDLPVTGEIIEASEDLPYLCLRLDFNAKQIFDILNESEQKGIKMSDSHQGLFVNKSNSSLLDAVWRLIKLLDVPEDIPVLAPVIIREILYRILQDEHGDAVKQIAMKGSKAQRIAEVIQLIKKNFTEPIRIDRLASVAKMSSSSLHHHFKQITSMSPIQYQKQLRLQEARRLMLSEAVDAANASFQVGYESPTQFSREYARLFGLPPMRDIKRLLN